MHLAGKLEGVVFRRSRRSDAPALAGLMRLKDVVSDGIPGSKCFESSSEQDFIELIETSLLCITALSSVQEDVVVGFIALGSVPKATGFPARRWDAILERGMYSVSSKEGDIIMPANTMWLNMLLSPPSSTHITGAAQAATTAQQKVDAEMQRKAFSAEQLCVELLTVSLGTSPMTTHVLCAIPSGGFPLLLAMGNRLPPAMSTKRPEDFTFVGDLIHLQRHIFIPFLDMRLGRIEDYDDFVPLLIKGDGVVTRLPDNFFLEEILKNQDENHKVVIAENPVTHQVIGLACLRIVALEDQQILSKQYSMDLVGKLRPLLLDPEVHAAKSASANPSNTFMIDFLYYNIDYNGSATDFVPFMFRQFPACEYATIILPHSLSEPPVLGRFEYLPVRKYQPHNSRGESLPVPEGLWSCCRYALEPAHVSVVRCDEEADAAGKFFAGSHLGLSRGTATLIQDDLTISFDKQNMGALSDVDPLPNTTVFKLDWQTRGDVVGVASARRMTVDDMYSLRSNFDLDEYVFYYAHTGKNYEATDISLSPEEGCRKFYTSEMRGVVIRGMYVRPPFRGSIRLFVREILRHYDAQVAVVLTNLDEECFPPLLKELVPTKPRRVIEQPLLSSTHPSPTRDPGSPDDGVVEDGAVEGEAGASTPATDMAALSTLFLTTPRCLGDELQRIHTRIVVVGASSTGLCFLQRLLAVPYVRFSNLLLVSTDGMPMHPNQEEYIWSADQMELLEREHVSLMIGNPIRVVSGTMADLDKVNKFISIDNGTFEPYDYLLLTTGRQYIPPLSIRRLQQQEGRPAKAGVIALNGQFAVDRLRHKLAEIDQNQSNFANVMVYGSGLDAFAAAASIVRVGFSPQRVVVCSPHKQIPLMDDYCSQAAVALLKTMGTNVLRGFDVSRMEYDDDNNLTTVMLAPVSEDHNAAGSVELACCLVVCLEEKDIDANVLSALNKRSIVFDGRVIVENNYRTTDPFVFAAGPVAMFTRRYGATQSFDDVNARDVGFHLSQVLMGHLGYDEFLDPKFHSGGGRGIDGAETNNLYTKVLEENGSRVATMHGAQLSVQAEELSETAALETLHRLPKYCTPLSRRVRFPAGYNFFTTFCVNFDSSRCLRLDCSTLDMNHLYEPVPVGSITNVSGTVTDEQNYLAIYVNESSRVVEGISYFGNGEPEVHNYRALIGYPESLLTLVFRYAEAVRIAEQHPGDAYIPGAGLTVGVVNGRLDLMQYLRLPHLQTVFYDRFGDFFNVLREKMRQHDEAVELQERVLNEHQHDCDLSTEQIDTYKEALTSAQSAFKHQVQLELIRFLHEHKDFRPQNMYLPDMRSRVV